MHANITTRKSVNIDVEHVTFEIGSGYNADVIVTDQNPHEDLSIYIGNIEFVFTLSEKGLRLVSSEYDGSGNSDPYNDIKQLSVIDFTPEQIGLTGDGIPF